MAKMMFDWMMQYGMDLFQTVAPEVDFCESLKPLLTDDDEEVQCIATLGFAKLTLLQIIKDAKVSCVFI